MAENTIHIILRKIIDVWENIQKQDNLLCLTLNVSQLKKKQKKEQCIILYITKMELVNLH